MPKIINLIQGSNEWRAWRKGKVTASMIAAIMNLDPWTTPLQEYNRQLLGEEISDNEFMKHGRDTEEEARQWLNKYCGAEYRPICMEHDSIYWLACSLDAWDENSSIKGGELKCPKKRIEQLANIYEIPVHYYPQVQCQMFIAEQDEWRFLLYSKESQDGIPLVVKRDDLFIEKMLISIKAFYDRLNAFDPPDPIDGRDVEILDDPDATNALSLFKINKGVIDSLEKENEALKQLIIDKANGKSVKIGNTKVTKVITKGRVDYASIPEIKEMDVEPFRKPNTTSWRIS